MAKKALLATVAGISSLLTSTQLAAANGLEDQVGSTAAAIIALGWLGFLSFLALAIILPLIRR
jgi:hypothetical protein